MNKNCLPSSPIPRRHWISPAEELCACLARVVSGSDKNCFHFRCQGLTLQLLRSQSSLKDLFSSSDLDHPRGLVGSERVESIASC